MLEAGEAIMKIYRAGIEAEYKEDGSPVTKADRHSEEILLSGINQFAPGVPIISEENLESHKIKPDDYFFLVDPLDGTKEFLDFNGAGNFTVNIGLIFNGQPIMGLIYVPVTKKLFLGISTRGSYVEDEVGNIKRMMTNTKFNSSSEIIAVASKKHRSKSTDDWLLKNKITEIISASSSIKFCSIANGEADVYPRFGPTMEWDTAAGHAILLGAGGYVTLGDEKTILSYGKTEYRNSDFIAWGCHKSKT